MAAGDFLSRDTDNFVLPAKTYYPLKIPIAHYQLRHFISSPEPDLLYYASGTHVYCLNTATRTQAHVATLPWDARCTAVGHGYVCVGGADDGNFAAIRVSGFPPTDSFDVDDPLSLGLANPSRRLPPLGRDPLGSASNVRLEKIGEDIVNSISIHEFPAQGIRERDVVAVLTNNDKTVRIYSLIRKLELTVLDLPFALNHATISPDGQMLVAVGDAPIGFFFERTASPTKKASKSTNDSIMSTPPDWTLLHQIRLHRPTDSHSDGYFTTAWASSGRLCAMGSECGYITVFDVPTLKVAEYGEDAVVHLISSSRPDIVTGAGAVRTMHFSPAPWDFLIWGEDQGRACVADLRAGLKVKQMLSLDVNADGVEKAEISEFDWTANPEMHELRRETEFIRRYRRALDSDGTAAAVNAATEYLEADSDRRRLHRRLGVVESDNDPHGLTAHERQVLETLRTTRQREEGRGQGITPRSINYTGSDTVPAFEIVGLSNVLEDTETLYQSSRTAEPDTSQSASYQPSAAFRARRTTPPGPRRQASVVVSIDEGTVNAPHGQIHITDSALTRSPNPVLSHTRRVASDIITSTDEAWRTIEAALNDQARSAARSTTADPNEAPINATAPELRSELRRLRQLTQMRERLRTNRASQLETYQYSLGMRRASRAIDPSLGVRTAGLAMSQDGRTLYCGTEDGIFEFKMNLHIRKAFPAIAPR